MKQHLQIQNGLVFICGPSTVGKTTLAHQIFATAPYPDKVLLSQDQILRDFIKSHGFSEEVFYAGLPEAADVEFRIEVARIWFEAFSQKKFVVFEGTYCDAERLAILLSTMPCLGLQRPITLLKLLLPWELHLQFLQERLPSFDTTRCFQQRQAAERFSAPHYFSREITWVREYNIADPREVELEFLKSGELTREHWSIFVAYEWIHDSFGPAVITELEKHPRL